MEETRPTAELILDAAEHHARAGGYNGFSYRDIADAVGIKTASIHYHFPGKAQLGVALAERYTNRFLDALGAPEGPGWDAALSRLVEQFRAAARHDGQMCLCGLFGAEVQVLPDPVADQTRLFFDRVQHWLRRALRAAHPTMPEAEREARSLSILAQLEGAVLIARVRADPRAFDLALSTLR